MFTTRLVSTSTGTSFPPLPPFSPPDSPPLPPPSEPRGVPPPALESSGGSSEEAGRDELGFDEGGTEDGIDEGIGGGDVDDGRGGGGAMGEEKAVRG